MSLVARVFAYLSASLVAFGAAAPWVTVDGEPGGASPLGLAIALSAALAITVATLLRRRDLLAPLAVAVGLLAVLAIWQVPGEALVASAGEGAMRAGIGGGLSMILLGAMLLYVAARLPAPRAVAGVAPARS